MQNFPEDYILGGVVQGSLAEVIPAESITSVSRVEGTTDRYIVTFVPDVGLNSGVNLKVFDEEKQVSVMTYFIKQIQVIFRLATGDSDYVVDITGTKFWEHDTNMFVEEASFVTFPESLIDMFTAVPADVVNWTNYDEEHSSTGSVRRSHQD